MTTIDRRTFLRGAAAAGVALTGGPFRGFLASAAAAPGEPGRPLSYGPLRPTADLATGEENLLLPSGFSYRSFHQNTGGATLHDGTVIPGRHDGMAAFAGPDGRTVLVRNHEINGPVGHFGPRRPGRTYDTMAGGGTTTVVVDARGNVQDSFTSLNGTQMNCSGGPVPWGSWITCEETVNGPDVGDDFTGQDNSLLNKPHGYIFEVPADEISDGTPVRNAGRFAHEAAAWDHRTEALYLTEDNFGFPSGFYRYLPPSDPMQVRRLVDGGELQMLKVKGQWNRDLSGLTDTASEPAPRPGDVFEVEWVTIPAPDPDVTGFTNDQAIVAVGDQGRAQGAAIFSRLEGAEADGGTVYFCSTQGGRRPAGEPAPFGFGDGRGQIWAYHSATETLHLLYESPSKETLDLPDNIAVSRSGTLILCEDGGEGNYLRGLTDTGRIFDFAKNNITGRTDDEFAGSTWSHDHETLFVNIQASVGRTFAIWGPWGRGGF